MNLTYQIDHVDVSISAGDANVFTTGEDVVLAQEYSDLALEQAWKEAGHTTVDASEVFNIVEVQRDITNILRTIIADISPSTDLDGFTLERYHKYVDDALHYAVIGKTRRLYPQDFGFEEQRVVGFLSRLLSSRLGYMNPVF